MYSFASRSQRYAPTPRTIIGGSPPTDLNARTGEFTPPGITFSARCCALRERSVLRDMGIDCKRLHHGGTETRRTSTWGRNALPPSHLPQQASCHGLMPV